MIIKKILNNNVITTIDENSKQEKVVMGRGIAFKKSPGDYIEKEKIEKVFKIENEKENKTFQKLMDEIPMEYANIAEEIIDKAQKTLKVKFSEHIYIALTDHIYFAITRYKKGIKLKNDMLWEIRRIHKEEYNVGLWAIDYIKEKTGIEMEPDEAAFIALHFIEASYNTNMNNTINITNIINEILNIIKYNFSIDIDEDDISYDRFLTHLKYFSQRVITNKKLPDEGASLLQVVIKNYEEAYKCTLKIKQFVLKNYNYNINDSETVYLTIHIERMVSSIRKNK